MKLPPALHSWSVAPNQAIAIQRRLAGTVSHTSPRSPIRLVAGVDAAYSTDGVRCLGAVVLWDVHRDTVIEAHLASRALRFPYVPGLLSFREAPAVLAAVRKLRTPPHCLIYDGHGVAHPRRFGVACHVGVLTDTPTIGCAKRRLVGSHRIPGQKRGSRTRLLERGEVIGTVLRTRSGVRPVYVSVGHRISLRRAEAVVLRCAVRFRLPEPTRLADRLVASARREGR
jgi:deoxyribonuclease V